MKKILSIAVILTMASGGWPGAPMMPDDSSIQRPGPGETAPWMPLFDGHTLSGWTIAGGGKWSVQDGCIVGERGDGRHGWLVTERAYADFYLELNFKMESPGNSGIQLRSHLLGETMAGYQADILPPGDDRTGGVYEEHGRGWVQLPGADNRLSIELGEWYSYRISVIGDRITTVVDDAVRVDVVDNELQSRMGFIALQVHSGDEPLRMRWKDLRIQDYGYAGTWAPLFNGKDLSNFTVQGTQPWVIEDGTVMGRNNEEGGNGYLATRDEYSNFMARVKYKFEGEGNSGLFFRSRFQEADVWGVQSEIAPKPEEHISGFYESGGRSWIAQPKLEQTESLLNPEWNEIMVYASGNHLRAYLNGFKLVDFFDPENQHTRGKLGLQVHSGKTCKIRFKDFAVIDLGQ